MSMAELRRTTATTTITTQIAFTSLGSTVTLLRYVHDGNRHAAHHGHWDEQ